MKKINSTAPGVYSTHGAAFGLLYGTMNNSLALGLCFGFAIGLIIDGAVHASK